MTTPVTQGEFLRQLRKGRSLSLRETAELLATHGYEVTHARIAHFEANEPLGSRSQMAYCEAFNLADEERLLLQRLAAEAAGFPSAEHAA